MTTHHDPLRDGISIRTVAGREVVVIADWKAHIDDFWVRKMREPERPLMTDLWVVCADHADAQSIAHRISRTHDLPMMTRGRAPTFGDWNHNIPRDVAVYYSCSDRIVDEIEIERLHPAPNGLVCRIERRGLRYLVQSMTRGDSTAVAYGPATFADRIQKAYAGLLARQGPGFDTRRKDLNASPVLAAILETLVRPAAELVSHWLEGVGREKTDHLVLSPHSFRTDLPIRMLILSTRGVNRRACFRLEVGGYTITDDNLSGLMLPDTVGTAFSAMALKGELMLSRIVDLPGAERIRVVSMEQSSGRWTARLDPIGVSLSPPASDIPFSEIDYLSRLDEDGYMFRSDVVEILARLTTEQVCYILREILDGSAGCRLDVSAWMPAGMTTTISVDAKVFVREAHTMVRPIELMRKTA